MKFLLNFFNSLKLCIRLMTETAINTYTVSKNEVDICKS
jgi:hypothetical protein